MIFMTLIFWGAVYESSASIYVPRSRCWEQLKFIKEKIYEIQKSNDFKLDLTIQKLVQVSIKRHLENKLFFKFGLAFWYQMHLAAMANCWTGYKNPIH